VNLNAPEQDKAQTADWTEARPVARPGAARFWAALVLIGCVALLGVAAYLKPDPRGYGTHQQLGAGPCGMLVMTGLPCPTCGMTTAFAYTVRGQFLQAFRAQPAGFLLAVGTGVLALACGWTLARGRWPMARLWLANPHKLFLLLLVLLLGGWAGKIVIGLSDGTLPYPPK
jgi:hypothetical protein